MYSNTLAASTNGIIRLIKGYKSKTDTIMAISFFILGKEDMMARVSLDQHSKIKIGVLGGSVS